MIPEAIRAAFRWWAKHPWIVFWGTSLLTPFIFSISLRIISDLGPQRGTLLRILVLAYASFLLLFPITWILSFGRGVFVIWQRSKVRAIAVVLFVIVLGFIARPNFYSSKGHYPDDLIKSNIKKAVTAQEAYFVDHETYTSNIDRLKGYGYYQSDNVTMGASATETTFIITGIATERCKRDTGTWSFNSTTGEITGTRCR